MGNYVDQLKSWTAFQYSLQKRHWGFDLLMVAQAIEPEAVGIVLGHSRYDARTEAVKSNLPSMAPWMKKLKLSG